LQQRHPPAFAQADLEDSAAGLHFHLTDTRSRQARPTLPSLSEPSLVPNQRRLQYEPIPGLHLRISPTTGWTRTIGTPFHLAETRDIQIGRHYIGALISSRTIAGNRHQQLSQTSKDIRVKKSRALLLAHTYLLRKLCSTKHPHNRPRLTGIFALFFDPILSSYRLLRIPISAITNIFRLISLPRHSFIKQLSTKVQPQSPSQITQHVWPRRPTFIHPPNLP
jgi:hypothetical protein